MSLFWQPFKLKGANNELRCKNFVIHAVKCIRIAVLIRVDISPLSTILWFKRHERHDKPSWSKPLDVKRWVGEGLKNKLSRCIEFARDEHFWFSRFRTHIRCICRHRMLFTFFLVCSFEFLFLNFEYCI